MQVSQGEFAKLLGVSKAHISKLVSDGWLRPVEGRRLDPGQAMRGYVEHLRVGRYAQRVADRRTKLIEQQERRLKLQNDVEAGLLMPVEEHEEAVKAILGSLAVSLNGFGAR